MSDVSKTLAKHEPEISGYGFFIGCGCRFRGIDDYHAWAKHVADALESATRLPAQGEAGAAVERVRAVADQWNATPDYSPSEYDKGRVDQRHDMTEQLLAALDGAPEPEGEWEYGRRYFDEAGDPHIRVTTDVETPDGHRADGTPYWNYEVVRRRKAGPWEPIEGESE